MAESLQYAPRTISTLPLPHMPKNAPRDIPPHVACGTSLLVWLGPMPSSMDVESGHKPTNPILVESLSTLYQ